MAPSLPRIIRVSIRKTPSTMLAASVHGSVSSRFASAQKVEGEAITSDASSAPASMASSDERRVGKEGVSTCRSGWLRFLYSKTTYIIRQVAAYTQQRAWNREGACYRVDHDDT